MMRNVGLLQFTRFTLFILVNLFWISGCNAMGTVNTGAAYGDLEFSPDGQTLVFREYKPDGTRGIGFLDLQSGDRRFIPAPDGHRYTGPTFSPDGRQIVAALFRSANESQLVIMDVDGNNIRELSHDRGCYTDPSFSPDGKRVIYIYSPLPETVAAKKCLNQDVYEVELSSGRSNQLTDYKFYLATFPHYLPDGKHFVFSGDGPRSIMEEGEYEKIYGENYIFIMTGSDDDLHPAITGYEYSRDTSVSGDGEIIFLVRTNKMDNAKSKYNYDLFSRSRGQDRRLTNLRGAIIYHTISFDGERIAFLIDNDPRRSGNYEMMIMNADGSGLRSLGISGRLF